MSSVQAPWGRCAATVRLTTVSARLQRATSKLAQPCHCCPAQLAFRLNSRACMGSCGLRTQVKDVSRLQGTARGSQHHSARRWCVLHDSIAVLQLLHVPRVADGIAGILFLLHCWHAN